MLAVITRQFGPARRVGRLGDVLNPTAGSQLDCGLFAGGVFKPACWAIQLGPTIVGKSNYDAAVALANPDVVYPPLPLPAPPPAVTNYGVSETVPPTVEQANQAVSDALAASAAATQAQNLNYFSQVSANLDQLTSGQGSSIPTWLLVGGGALALVLVLRR